MSTAPTPASPAPPPSQPARPNEVTVYSHSTLFYWWPVWLIGFIMAIITMAGGEYMVVFPKGAEGGRKWSVDTKNGKQEREGFLLPEKSEKHLAPNKEKADLEKDPELTLHASSKKHLGVLFATILLLVIFITNVPLRGMWSLLVISFIIVLSLVFALFDVWDVILAKLSLLDIRINMAGYVLISGVLLGLWLFAFFFMDRQVYITFVPGAMKVRLEIGHGEKQYDTIGMTIEKERSDLFRHWILGIGSGDITVRTSGADRHEFHLVNVLFVNRKLAQIEDMQRIRQERTA